MQDYYWEREDGIQTTTPQQRYCPKRGVEALGLGLGLGALQLLLVAYASTRELDCTTADWGSGWERLASPTPQSYDFPGTVKFRH